MKKYLMALLVLCVMSSLALAEETAEKSKVYPKKVEADKNHDGKIDHIEYFENGEISRVEDDSDFDGVIDEHTQYEKGKPVKSERDTNKDGKPDTWVTY